MYTLSTTIFCVSPKNPTQKPNGPQTWAPQTKAVVSGCTWVASSSWHSDRIQNSTPQRKNGWKPFPLKALSCLSFGHLGVSWLWYLRWHSIVWLVFSPFTSRTSAAPSSTAIIQRSPVDKLVCTIFTWRQKELNLGLDDTKWLGLERLRVSLVLPMKPMNLLASWKRCCQGATSTSKWQPFTV